MNSLRGRLAIAALLTITGCGSVASDRLLDPHVDAGTTDSQPPSDTGADPISGSVTFDTSGFTLGGAALESDGRLEVFAVAQGGAMMHKWQTSPGRGTWSDWASLGGSLKLGSGAARNADGRLEVFGVWIDGDFVHAWQLTPGGTWTSWFAINSGVTNGVGAVLLPKSGHLEVLMNVGGDLYGMEQTQPSGGGWNGQLSWAGTIEGGAGPTVNLDGRKEMFAIGSDNQMVHLWETSPGGAVHDWTSLGGSFLAGSGAVMNADGRLEVFGIGIDKTMLHAGQTTAGGAWSAWSSLGGAFSAGVGVAANADGRLEVFGIGTDKTMLHAWQTSPGGTWSAWMPL